MKVIGALAVFWILSVLAVMGLPQGNSHSGIHIVAGISEYSDGYKEKSIIAYTHIDGRLLIREIPFSKQVDFSLLKKTLLNQDGFTQNEIKKYGYAIDGKRRHLFISGNSVTIRGVMVDDIKWTYSQTLTDSVFFTFETSEPSESEKLAEFNKSNAETKKSLTKWEQMAKSANYNKTVRDALIK